MQISLTTYQIVAGALINATAVIIGASLNVFYAPWLQCKRDNERWAREKLYDLHSEAYEALTNLLKSVAAINTLQASEVSSEFYASVGALSRLRLAYENDSAKEILSIENDLRSVYKGFLIQKRELENLEDLRQRLFVITQSDSRLKDLFN
ncbi:MAG TPA: hypothetical protein VEZ50_07985 [Nodosilinea sp.]|nr:hypothetical protein [Nodosilinea sp.]